MSSLLCAKIPPKNVCSLLVSLYYHIQCQKMPCSDGQNTNVSSFWPDFKFRYEIFLNPDLNISSKTLLKLIFFYIFNIRTFIYRIFLTEIFYDIKYFPEKQPINTSVQPNVLFCRNIVLNYYLCKNAATLLPISPWKDLFDCLILISYLRQHYLLINQFFKVHLLLES